MPSGCRASWTCPAPASDCTLLLVAGEDRRQARPQVHAHYLCGQAASHELCMWTRRSPRRRAGVPSARRAVVSRVAVRARDARPARDHARRSSGSPAARPPRLLARGLSSAAGRRATPDFGDEASRFHLRRSRAKACIKIPVGPVHAGVIEPGSFPVQRARRDDPQDAGAPVLHAQGHREAVRRPACPPTASRWPNGSPATRVSAMRWRSARPSRSSGRRGDSWRGARWAASCSSNWSGSTTTSVTWARFSPTPDLRSARRTRMRLRESLLRLNKRLTGHRLLRGVVVPGGLARARRGRRLIAGTRADRRGLRRRRRDQPGQHARRGSARRNRPAGRCGRA